MEKERDETGHPNHEMTGERREMGGNVPACDHFRQST